MSYESSLDREPLALPGETRPNNRRRVIVIAAVVAILVALFLVFGRGGKPAAPRMAATEQAPPVTVTMPGRQQVDRTITANGSLAARRELPVGIAGEGGRVTRVLVEPGQWVAAGQVLAVIDSSVQLQTAQSLAAQIKVAQADANLTQANLDRAQKLVANGFVSRADIEARMASRDAAAARVRVAQAQLGQQRAVNGRLDIRAPAAGLVLTRQVEPGQIVSAGSGVLFRMAQGGEMEMRAVLSEGDLAGLRAGVRASVTPVGSEASFAGQVWQVSPVIDPQSRQGMARIALKYNAALRPGGFATAAIVSGASNVPMLPESAVQSDRTGNYVYIVDAQDRATKRPVKVGEVTDRGVSIVEGLNGTERVVMAAGAFLSPGQKVKPVLKVAPAPVTQSS